MGHCITFNNCCNGWHNALPIGNGVMGAMAFYRHNRLCLALNHYDVYYRILERYGRRYQARAAAGDYPRYNGPTYRELERLADETYRDWRKEPINQYFESLHHSMQEYGGAYRGVSHPPTGELSLCFADEMEDPEESQLRLDMEEAKISFWVKSDAGHAEAVSRISADSDYMITDVSQSTPGIIRTIILEYPQRRLQEGYACSLNRIDGHTVYYTVSFYPPGENVSEYPPYSFTVAVKLLNQSGRAECFGNRIRLSLAENSCNFQIITAVFGGLQGGSSLAPALRKLPDSKARIRQEYEDHRLRWSNFWGRSAVRLPDRFLETLWYMSLYTLECSSGKGGRLYEQASGLSGLWDIRQPTVWGSTWYWDVNIEASYWPVYTANHLELGKVFCDGFLSYGRLAEQFACDVYGVEGWAMDYPHALYNCIAPWCAQYLWWYYEYSGDLVFLREKAYPCFRAIIRFLRKVVKYDARRHTYYFYPDISPEQGPLTRNSVITLATVKYLLQCAIRAGELLGEKQEVLDGYRELFSSLPSYPLCRDGGGYRLKDSEYAPPDLWLRHPSLLMPVYPIGEISRNSDARTRTIGRNTLEYAIDNTEIGVFGFGWLSCCASRLGEGAGALRLLYEKGLDYCIRSNGLGYEETERWINYCCVEQQPLYYPPMMEASGEIAAAINEMLLQNLDGIIDVFPAVPDGKTEPMRERMVYEHERQDRFAQYEEWKNCWFDKLLAKGGFEVSARWKDGRTAWVMIKSLYGNTARVRNSFTHARLFSHTPNGWAELACHTEKGVICFQTDKNRSYLLCGEADPEMPPPLDEAAGDGVLIHQAHTHRRIFLGEDENTAFIKSLDGFLFEYCTGNTRHSPMTVYKFDFGLPEDKLAKDYSGVVHRQSMTTERQMSLGQTFIRIDDTVLYSTALGYGFDKTNGLRCEDREGPDAIRRDFVCGAEPVRFNVELPKGKYDLLVISGDAERPSCTNLELQPAGISLKGRILRKGRYQCSVLPVLQNEDGVLGLAISTEFGYYWNVNALLINKAYSLL